MEEKSLNFKKKGIVERNLFQNDISTYVSRGRQTLPTKPKRIHENRQDTLTNDNVDVKIILNSIKLSSQSNND